ncbi:multiple RNA-binding domain-containing protein 1 [Ascodesmis nigricans]|uniref:Multiple RNA-binding domain-containing protein 1 n=1 Tax=Ascodesmis nigricans TaxID=341454 RepID=A0A4S2MLE9_9PEZI|nr:multiple RNA-binding domain-containing protein 1 [Ascodesmis nigricans]
MSTSRIFVKNIPPSSTESSIRSHFSVKGPITDVRVIPHRRIAYVGYKTPQDAESAVKYFNRSYVQTSKINVEIARPIGKSDPLSAPKRDIQSDSPTKKRKREESEHVAPKAGKKFEQFLQTMTATSHKNTWSNHDGPLDEPVIQNDVAMDTGIVEPTLDPQPVPEPARAKEIDSSTSRDVNDEPQPVLDEDDWLRSKTSRLLDVTDDIDSRLAASSLNPTRDAQPVQEDQAPAQNMEVDDAESASAVEDTVMQTGRLFVRNLPYSATEQDLTSTFAQFGTINEVHLSLDSKTNASKGYAYILYDDPANALSALNALDGSDFQGRLMHVLPAAPKRENKLDEFAIAKLPLKQQRAIKKKAEASTTQFNWNSMYMNADAVISSVASRLGVSKSELLDPTSSDAAVRQAHAETALINETKTFLQQNGVNLEAFNNRGKDDRVLLIKNFPFTTSSDEIRKILVEFGELKRLIFPPAGTLAIAEYSSSSSGRTAFSALAYRRYKGSVLFLEKGPKDLFTGEIVTDTPTTFTSTGAAPPVSAQALKDISTAEPGQETSTLYIRNLNFSTTTERLESFFSSLDGFLWCRVKTKTDAKHPGKVLSMGFGFAEFSSVEHAKAALNAMNGKSIDNHSISISMAKRNDAVETGKKKAAAGTGAQKKLVVKNLPFEATKKDIRALLGKYGSLQSVRMPKKLGNKTRGFAFAEFVTVREAENAMNALKDTHLLGRRLVIDFAQGDTGTAEEEIEKMSKKVMKQTEAVALQGLRVKSKATVKLNAEGGLEGEEDM